MISDGGEGTALVVDDDRGMRAVLRTLLEMEGWDVVEAEDGPVALKAYETHAPDLVLTDLHMPGMHGEELARRLREERAEDGPIVAITRHSPTAESRQLFNAVLTKPVPIRELRRWLRGGEETPEAADDAPVTGDKPGETGDDPAEPGNDPAESADDPWETG